MSHNWHSRSSSFVVPLTSITQCPLTSQSRHLRRLPLITLISIKFPLTSDHHILQSTSQLRLSPLCLSHHAEIRGLADVCSQKRTSSTQTTWSSAPAPSFIQGHTVLSPSQATSWPHSAKTKICLGRFVLLRKAWLACLLFTNAIMKYELRKGKETPKSGVIRN